MYIIGSSYTLLNNQYGEEIDSFDDVIRFNRAQLKVLKERWY